MYQAAQFLGSKTKHKEVASPSTRCIWGSRLSKRAADNDVLFEMFWKSVEYYKDWGMHCCGVCRVQMAGNLRLGGGGGGFHG